MSAEVEEKKGVLEVLGSCFVGECSIPDLISTSEFWVAFLSVVFAAIAWLLKEYYKELREIFRRGYYLEEPNRVSLEEKADGDKPQHEFNLKYTDYVEQFQRGTSRKLYHQSLGHLLRFIAYLTKEKIHFSVATQSPNPFSGIFTTSVFTQKSFELCLKLALFYPLVFLIISWGIGGAGKLGEFEVLGSSAALPLRWLFIAGLIVSILLLYKSFQAKGFWSYVYFIAAVAGAVAFAGAGAGAVAFAGAGAGAFAVAGAFSVAGAVAVAFSVAGAVAVAGAFSVAVAGAFSVAFVVIVVVVFIANYYHEKEFKYYWWCLCGFFMVYSVVAIVVVLSKTDLQSNLQLIALPLFLGVLPIVNSVVDWISLGCTRAFLFKLYNGADFYRHTVALTVIDLLLALIFMLVLIANTVAVIALVNVLSVEVAGKIAFNLTPIFKSLQSGENWQDNLWIHAMMLSTLVPTFLHFIFALIGLLMPLLSPLTKDELIELKQSKPKKLNDKIFWATVYRKPIVILASLSIVVGICSPIYHHGDVAFDFLLNHAVNVAEFIHPEGIDRSVIFPAS